MRSVTDEESEAEPKTGSSPASLSGAVVVDKPPGKTSHDVVNRLRRLTGIRKIGHLGTLDPNATGVLPLLIGRATRLAQFYGKSSKRYEGVVTFGYSTDTYDVEGRACGELVPVNLSREWLESAALEYQGKLQQTPPPVSAKKVGGVPAYKMARRNQPVELAPVEIEIFNFEIRDVEQNEASIYVHCSAGTYIRSVAHDLGQKLGTGAFLRALRRTASGEFDLASARTLEELGELAREGQLASAITPCADLLRHLPSETVDAVTAGFIRQGRDFRVSPFRSGMDSKWLKAITEDGELVAIGEIVLPHLYHPILVL